MNAWTHTDSCAWGFILESQHEISFVVSTDDWFRCLDVLWRNEICAGIKVTVMRICWINCTFMCWQSTHQPIYAPDTTQFMTHIETLHVAAPGWYPQGVSGTAVGTTGFVWTRSVWIKLDGDSCLCSYCVQNVNSYEHVSGMAIA
jgi:hypothetical protein